MNKIDVKPKPFFLKKRFLIPFGILLLLLIKCTKTDTSTPQNKKVSIQTEKKSEEKIDLKTKLENNIKGIDEGQDLAKNVKSLDGIVIVLALYKVYSSIINEGKSSKNNDEQELAKKLEKKVIDSQVKTFPKLRRIYYELIKEKLWVNDVDVKILGPNNKTIQFTAGYFASNKNIQETQTTLHEMLLNLRFKQTQYKWYSGDDEYTYYNIESSKDSEIID
ncbi:hypothetical protein HHL23_03160 [Chryseobacterium sp. RP-3-3]|uniref:Uncharacterized protein n=1 Tax=Chryseobacterium antibioticum TaxID=2728847 RepID=A0A7Y0AK23_9FLAO|nr:hypothetical protein [Chryseobacterium antibioticum]NML68796.1 hypothetical protein [Chryseobacterium antibioticum]